ncbi:N-acetylmuramoyl-L-alanine amidase (plasmid) [Paraclostridium ghonii]|uniref:N-acetylmuramoyl-L-alanine amidase n=1 Tax=Paraclostridium ghonii TaxID=29358 RepID=UPI00202CB875|nr:N-acetylmuramoyl-L-alanine amidase [Paeniclostridium ghonii]MCM0166532.1 N-acetylmuramoyl-L-alanine amidase [Paeniclostridium ghonii]
MSKVYIDLGHGGADSGAICRSKNVFEKNIVLEVGKLVESKLKACGIDVKLSRYNDITKSLVQRTTEANNWGADILVSIHVNDAENISAQGVETYCYKFAYRNLADCVHEELIKDGLYTKNRGIKEGNLHMVRESKMSACLVELFFINNEDDINKLLNKKDEFANAIAKGICKYLGINYAGGNAISPNEGFKNGDYSGKKARVIANTLNARYDRGTQYNVIGQVKCGDIVNLQYCLNDWVSIEGFKGNKGLGYVNSKYLQLL